MTYEKGIYLYLYLLLDEYSRKAIHWLVSWHQTAEEARDLLEGGLIDENILDVPEDKRPEVINDRGRQMKAKSIRQMFEDHHMHNYSPDHEPPMITRLWNRYVVLLGPPLSIRAVFWIGRKRFTALIGFFHGTTRSTCTQALSMSPRSNATGDYGKKLSPNVTLTSKSSVC